ncbi:Ppx/GppA phosphatase family protein [Stratiformator vulcanicus]|uniref:Exopolyphosphatase n=1 Tax=Stratiformator vulcanicus TaxID=2527980 RepID=A0A517QXD9_9PLAN|nr:exopolyphosphatase [Stratiformator vulcanicus]QDT36253.1 Exopolyphosphatase [Stratiformator vulcanicus]
MPTKTKPSTTPAVAEGPVAVIDIGTASVRMAVAEVTTDGELRILERLSQAVHLGKDTFTNGSISTGTTEQCVRVLRDYQHLLKQYGLPDRPQRMRIVATSAVREATNRLTFLDRIYSATGLQVEPIDESEANRVTYLSILPILQRREDLRPAYCIVTEVGGGSTELVAIQDGDVVTSQNYRLGTLRLQEMLDKFHTPSSTARQIMSRQIDRAVGQIVRQLPEARPGTSTELVVLGADMRFAAQEIAGECVPRDFTEVNVEALAELTDRMLGMNEDELMREYHLALPDAETLGPALLANLSLARVLGLSRVLVSDVNLRDGLLLDLAATRVWTEQAGRQVINSAVELGRKFDFDERHATHVASLAARLFDLMQREHLLDRRYRMILRLASLLYAIGQYVGTTGYHKHSMYLIQNSDLFGLGKKELLLVALVARYHRRASPKPSHQYISSLDRRERVVVAKLAAMLRIAIALDESHSRRITEFQVLWEKNRMLITVDDVDDLSLEQLAINQSGTLFEEVFGRRVLLRTASRERRP